MTGFGFPGQVAKSGAIGEKKGIPNLPVRSLEFRLESGRIKC
jgi:hypothetical protein